MKMKITNPYTDIKGVERLSLIAGKCCRGLGELRGLPAAETTGGIITGSKSRNEKLEMRVKIKFERVNFPEGNPSGK